MLYRNNNEIARKTWLQNTLAQIPAGMKLLDAGAGELSNRIYCNHLEYVSQDFCQYKGRTGGAITEGLQKSNWNTSKVDIISDIVSIPVPNDSFDAVLCSEVLEHIPEPDKALDEFSRLLKQNGILIITAPFVSLVHMAPYHHCTGFSRYWYEYHLPLRGFIIKELSPNGDWYALLKQEIDRLGSQERQRCNWAWPLAYLYSIFGSIYFNIRRDIKATDLACFGWHCVAVKQ